MFTGIVRGCGSVREFTQRKRAWRLEIQPPKKFPSIKVGGSVAVDGVCLTVAQKKKSVLGFDVVAETVRRTHFGGLKKEAFVNLEPALRQSDRIDGHFVQGHVDAVGTIRGIRRQGPDVCFQIAYPLKLKPFLIQKGSITVNGVSLTLGPVGKKNFCVYLIPHTLKLSNFSRLKSGGRVNLEADILVKFFRTLN